MAESFASHRSKRQKTDKTGRLSALKKLKQLKSSKIKYKVDQLENVYDEVDEQAYSKTVLDRQCDDWIVDDCGGSGYVEDGREIFDDDLDDESLRKAAKQDNNKGPRKRKRDLETKKVGGSISSMFSNMANKKKAEEKIGDDDILGDLISELRNDTIQPIQKTPKLNDYCYTISNLYCITCGHEINSRTAIKHMEKCFNKYESQASFGSIFKTRIEGQVMFCDFYNPSNHTYCKRLRVICPEHCKDPKISDTEFCGCSLLTNVFDATGEFCCRAPKKNCVKHYVWEKLRRAEIDMERVRQRLKIDELVEQERQLRSNMASGINYFDKIL